MERFWLVVAIVGAIFGSYMVGQIGFAEGKLYVIMPLIAAVMWFMRRAFRLRMEKHNDQEGKVDQ